MIRTNLTFTIAYHFDYKSSMIVPQKRIVALMGMVIQFFRWKIQSAITLSNKLISTICCSSCFFYTTQFIKMFFFCFLCCFYIICIAHCDTIISFCINFPVYYYYYLVRVVVISYILNLKPLETITFKYCQSEFPPPYVA